MKLAVCSVLALALSIPAQAQWPPRDLKPEERLDEDLAIIVVESVEAAKEAKAVTTCTLNFSPSVIGNQQQSLYSTSYSGGCVTGNIVETVTWNWNSPIVTYYGEYTVQKKQLYISSGCLGSSGHVVSSPTGSGIDGPTTAVLEVRSWPNNALICTATKVLTVL